MTESQYGSASGFGVSTLLCSLKVKPGGGGGGAAPASGPSDTRARGYLVNGRNSDAPRTRQAIVAIEEPTPSIDAAAPLVQAHAALRTWESAHRDQSRSKLVCALSETRRYGSQNSSTTLR